MMNCLHNIFVLTLFVKIEKNYDIHFFYNIGLFGGLVIAVNNMRALVRSPGHTVALTGY